MGEILKGYTCSPDGSVTGFLPSDSLPSKSSTCFTFELLQIKSSDGGKTWSSPEVISSRTECFPNLTLPRMETGDGGGYNDYVSGGGSSGTNTQNLSYPLSASEMELLDQAKNKLAPDCAAGKVIASVWDLLKFRTNINLATNGAYDAASNIISFRNANDINFKNLLEELFHAYQHTYYPGGIRTFSKGKPGWTNIEFEAKVFYDICMNRKGVNSWAGTWNFPDNEKEVYIKWIKNLVKYGQTTELMTQYNAMLDLFNTHNPHYKGYKMDGLNATGALKEASLGCN